MTVFKLAALIWAFCVSALLAAQITVTGIGQVDVRPDQATVALGIEINDPSAVAAVNGVSKIEKAIRAAMAEVGIEASHINTTQFSLYRYQDGQRQTQKRMDMYRAQFDFIIFLKDVAKIGPVIEAGLEAGANELRGVTFSSSQESEARDKARVLAMKNARDKALTYAQSGLFALGPIASINGSGGNIGPMPRVMRNMAMAEAVSAPELSPSDVTVTDQVTVTFEIEPAQ